MATFINTVDGKLQVEIEPNEPQTYLPNVGQGMKSELDEIKEAITTYRGQPVVVELASEMTDDLLIYLYMGSEEGYEANHWYYYDTESEEWTDGGAYVANPVVIDDTLTQSGEAADAKVTGDELTQIKSDFKQKNILDGIVMYENWQHGIVTGSYTPVASTGNKHMYMLIPVADIPTVLYLRLKKTVSYNILYKLSYFNSSKTRLYTDANWRKITDGEPIAFSEDAIYQTLDTVGITIVYSTTTSTDDAISNIPLDDIYLSNPASAILPDVYKNINDTVMLEGLVGDIPEFQYGVSGTSMTPTKSHNNKYVIIDLDKMLANVYIYSTTQYYLMISTAIYTSDGTRLAYTDYAVKTNGSVVVSKSVRDTYPTAKYVSLTMLYSTDGTTAGKVKFIPEQNDTILRYGTKTLVERSFGPFTCTVEPNGRGDYTTINDAISATKDGDTIYILPGTYEETVHMWGKDRHLIGVSKDACIVYSGSGLYADPAIEANVGSLENITFISGNDDGLEEASETGKAYAMHVEYPKATPYSLIVRNCRFISALQAGVGIGCRYNQTIVFEDCHIETKASQFYSTYNQQLYTAGAALFHNDSTANHEGTGSLTFRNCVIRGAEKAVIASSLQNNTKMRVSFEDCLAYAGDDGSEDLTDIVTFYGTQGKGESPYFCGTDIYLSKLSYGNHSDELNYDKYWS